MKQTLLIFGLMALMLVGTTTAATYYVSTTGNDTSGDGTLAKPLRTLGAAIYGAKAVPEGSIIMVADGDYTQASTASNSIYTDKSYDIRGATKWGATIKCSNCATYVLYMGGTDAGVVNISNIIINNTNANTDCLGVRGSNGQAWINNIKTWGCKDGIDFTSTGGSITKGHIKNSWIDTSREAYSINLQSSATHSNINITNNTFTGDVDFLIAPGRNMTFKGNNYLTGRFEYRYDTSKSINNFTIINPITMYFYHSRNKNTYTIQNQKMISVRAGVNIDLIQFFNSTNFIVNNITFGNTTKPLDNTSTYTLRGVYIQTGSTNITVKNSKFYINKSTAAIEASGVFTAWPINNITIKDNNITISNRATYGIDLNYCVKNSKIIHNRLITTTNSILHGIGFGSESSTPAGACWRQLTNNLMANNYVNALNTEQYGGHHGIFAGYLDNATITNNYIYGSSYSFVFKNTHNSRFYNNVGINASFFGILHKGGSNITYRNMSISPSTKYSTYIAFSIGKESGNWAYTSARNISVYNTTIGDNSVLTQAIYLTHNSTSKFYNVNFNKTKVKQGTELKSNMTLYYSISVLDGAGITFNFSDGANTKYGPYQSATYLTNYFRSRYYSKSANTSWESYKYNATDGNTNINGTFTLDKKISILFYTPSTNQNSSLLNFITKIVMAIVFILGIVLSALKMINDQEFSFEALVPLIVGIICLGVLISL